ncbi:hypothetical protein [Oceaniglobus trochenteri]|uniref:hypothetical protein n=1 Tax=Oceaniglobus trochenteri TaxID=2763260 RepID=UPI001CFF9CE8|nr:hypothetical protein [Oceaniglobus trochenteri]
MGAALTIVFLFAVSSTIVRVAGVVLEHSGIPRSVARLQALSALSGTGFTTSESEDLLRHPARRRVLTFLMIAGSVGIASVAATLIVSALNVSTEMDGLVLQGVALVLALLFVRYVLFSKYVDDLICGAAYRWLNRHGDFGRSYVTLFQFADDRSIAEHWTREGLPPSVADWGIEGLLPLGIRAPGDRALRDATGPIAPGAEDLLILMGSAEAHEIFADRFGDPSRKQTRRRAH